MNKIILCGAALVIYIALKIADIRQRRKFDKEMDEWVESMRDNKRGPVLNQDTCVCCGAVIPEGRTVCPMCERS